MSLKFFTCKYQLATFVNQLELSFTRQPVTFVSVMGGGGGGGVRTILSNIFANVLPNKVNLGGVAWLHHSHDLHSSPFLVKIVLAPFR